MTLSIIFEACSSCTSKLKSKIPEVLAFDKNNFSKILPLGFRCLFLVALHLYPLDRLIWSLMYFIQYEKKNISQYIMWKQHQPFLKSLAFVFSNIWANPTIYLAFTCRVKNCHPSIILQPIAIFALTENLSVHKNKNLFS